MLEKTTIDRNSFSGVIYARAATYFETLPKGKYANSIFYLKAFLLFALYASSYIFFLFYTNSFTQLLFAALVLGLCHVFIPVNVSHDAIHSAISARAWINRFALLGFEITGSNSYMYRKKHLEAHYNKENGSKTVAIESQALLLQQKKNEQTKNLHYVYYLFYAMYMIFIRDLLLYFSTKESIPTKQYVKLFFFKTAYCLAFLVMPFIYIDLPWWQTLIALFFMYVIITVALVIILLMPTEKMEHSRGTNDEKQNEKWVIEILQHNVDFSPNSILLNLIAGGANLNVVHYLFPDVNHVHYNKLAAILEQTAKEFQLPYRKQVIKDVFGIHFNYIRNIQDTKTKAV